MRSMALVLALVACTGPSTEADVATLPDEVVESTVDSTAPAIDTESPSPEDMVEPLPDVGVVPDVGPPADLEEPAETRVPDTVEAPDLTEPDVKQPPAIMLKDAALYWAPVVYQDTANGGPDDQGPRADCPVAVNDDGDWVHNNNWDNLPAADARPAVYWGGAATEDYWYLTYAVYHPRDWEPLCTGLLTECHEGDLEEVQIIVWRIGGGMGQLLAVRTHGHGATTMWSASHDVAAVGDFDGDVDFVSPDGSVSASQSDEAHHFRLFVQAKGHGLAPCWAEQKLLKPFGFTTVSCPGPDKSFPGGDGLVLWPTLEPTDPLPSGAQDQSQALTYQLLAIETELWPRRGDIGSGQLFRQDGAFEYSGARGEPFMVPGLIGAAWDPDQFPNDSVSGRAPWNITIDGSNPGDAFFDPAFAWSLVLDIPDSAASPYTEHAYIPEAVQ